MRVIVVGAGEVGSYVADRLSRQGIDVYVVERDAKRAAHLAETSDVEVVHGSGTHPSVLAAAGIESADLLEERVEEIACRWCESSQWVEEIDEADATAS